MHWKTIAAIFGMLVCVMAAQGYPTLIGPTGAASLPTADTIGDATFAFAGTYYDTTNDPTYPVRLTYGLRNNWEIGGVFMGSRAADVLGAHTKFAVTRGRQGVAVGAMYTHAAENDTTALQGYVAYTRHLGLAVNGTTGNNLASPGLHATVGANWTRVEQAGAAADGARGFLIIDYRFADGIIAAVEGQTQLSRLGDMEAQSSAVIRVPILNDLVAEAGISNVTRTGMSAQADHRFFAGVIWAFSPTIDYTGGGGVGY